jgi:enoyl-CoA hydratase/carnithine racemase
MAVTASELDGEVKAALNDLLEGEPNAIAVAKQLTGASARSMQEAFDTMSTLSTQMFKSAEAHEGMTAYLEKRPASWVRHLTHDETTP